MKRTDEAAFSHTHLRKIYQQQGKKKGLLVFMMRLRLALSNPGKSLQRTLYIHIQNQHLRRFTTPGSVLRGTSIAPPLVNQSSLAWWSTGRRESVHHGLNTFFHPERTALFSKESRVTMAPEKGRTPCMINKRILYFLKTICLVEIKCL